LIVFGNRDALSESGVWKRIVELLEHSSLSDLAPIDTHDEANCSAPAVGEKLEQAIDMPSFDFDFGE
jgi:hypothetical protein